MLNLIYIGVCMWVILPRGVLGSGSPRDQRDRVPSYSSGDTTLDSSTSTVDNIFDNRLARGGNNDILRDGLDENSLPGVEEFEYFADAYKTAVDHIRDRIDRAHRASLREIFSLKSQVVSHSKAVVVMSHKLIQRVSTEDEDYFARMCSYNGWAGHFSRYAHEACTTVECSVSWLDDGKWYYGQARETCETVLPRYNVYVLGIYNGLAILLRQAGDSHGAYSVMCPDLDGIDLDARQQHAKSLERGDHHRMEMQRLEESIAYIGTLRHNCDIWYDKIQEDAETDRLVEELLQRQMREEEDRQRQAQLECELRQREEENNQERQRRAQLERERRARREEELDDEYDWVPDAPRPSFCIRGSYK